MRIEFRKNNKSVLSATLLLLASTMLLNFARAQEAPATKPTPSEVTMTAEAVAAPVATAPNRRIPNSPRVRAPRPPHRQSFATTPFSR